MKKNRFVGLYLLILNLTEKILAILEQYTQFSNIKKIGMLSNNKSLVRKSLEYANSEYKFVLNIFSTTILRLIILFIRAGNRI